MQRWKKYGNYRRHTWGSFVSVIFDAGGRSPFLARLVGTVAVLARGNWVKAPELKGFQLFSTIEINWRRPSHEARSAAREATCGWEIGRPHRLTFHPVPDRDFTKVKNGSTPTEIKAMCLGYTTGQSTWQPTKILFDWECFVSLNNWFKILDETRWCQPAI